MQFNKNETICYHCDTFIHDELRLEAMTASCANI